MPLFLLGQRIDEHHLAAGQKDMIGLEVAVAAEGLLELEQCPNESGNGLAGVVSRRGQEWTQADAGSTLQEGGGALAQGQDIEQTDQGSAAACLPLSGTSSLQECRCLFQGVRRPPVEGPCVRHPRYPIGTVPQF
jgi:hypothetical protein